MTRVTASPATRRRHKKVLKMAKGYRGRAKSCFTIAVRRVNKALTNAYRDRRLKKRTFRSLWIQRLNAAVRQYGVSYSDFMGRLTKVDLGINRKALSEIAMNDSQMFKDIFDKVMNDTKVA